MQIESLHDRFHDLLHFLVTTKPNGCDDTFKKCLAVFRKCKAFIRINSQRLGTRGYFGKVDFVTFGLLTPILNKKALFSDLKIFFCFKHILNFQQINSQTLMTHRGLP